LRQAGVDLKRVAGVRPDPREEGRPDVQRRPPILAFGVNAFDGYWQTRQHILSRLAQRGWPVGYTTPAMSIWERDGLRWRDAGWGSKSVSRDGVRIRYPGRVPALLHRWQAMDRMIVRRHARAFASSIEMKSTHVPIAYVFHPMFWPYVEAIDSCHVVYHADDRFAAVPGSGREVAAFERALCERAARIFAITPGVAQGLPQCAASKTVLVPNGADAEAYERASRSPVPALLARIPRPWVAYAGSLNEKIDFALINRLAFARRGIQWLLIGPTHGEGQLSRETRTQLELCRRQPNVHFLGVVDYSELPAYCAHVDANSMFYRTDGDGWWRDIYPLKLHECLATGRPLLSSDVSAVREFSEVVTICRSDADWLAAVDATVSGRDAGSAAARVAVARANDWESRVDRIEASLDALVAAEGHGRQ